jgi:hypothetical protein
VIGPGPVIERTVVVSEEVTFALNLRTGSILECRGQVEFVMERDPGVCSISTRS